MRLVPVQTPAAPPGFAALYRDHYAPMVRLAYLLTGDAQVAEELTQDAFVRLYRRWTAVRNPPSYLRRAVVNACRSHHRRLLVERRHPPGPEQSVELPEPDETWQRLAGLPPRRREALVLRYYQDLPVAEVAAALGCGTETAKSLIHRGLSQLRKEVRTP